MSDQEAGPPADGVLTAEHVLEFPYSRSVGPVLGRFFTGLRDGRVEGVRADGGTVVVPPTEYDPISGRSTGDPVTVADEGVVTTWTWVAEPRAGQPFDRPFAWALVKLDGADTAMLHAVDVADRSAMSTGMRVQARWRDDRVGHINDIECFVPQRPGGAS